MFFLVSIVFIDVRCNLKEKPFCVYIWRWMSWSAYSILADQSNRLKFSEKMLLAAGANPILAIDYDQCLSLFSFFGSVDMNTERKCDLFSQFFFYHFAEFITLNEWKIEDIFRKIYTMERWFWTWWNWNFLLLFSCNRLISQ